MIRILSSDSINKTDLTLKQTRLNSMNLNMKQEVNVSLLWLLEVNFFFWITWLIRLGIRWTLRSVFVRAPPPREYTAWWGRYNSAFCSHHLPAENSNPIRKRGGTARICILSDVTYRPVGGVTGQLYPQDTWRSVKANQSAKEYKYVSSLHHWRCNYFETTWTKHDLPGSEYASVQFCHDPSLVNRLLWGRGFNRPFVSSLPGRKLRRCGPHDNDQLAWFHAAVFLPC